MLKISFPYAEIFKSDGYINDEIVLIDHLGGFDIDGNNQILHRIDSHGMSRTVIWHEYLDPTVKARYPNIEIVFDPGLKNFLTFTDHAQYHCHPDINYKNFLCSFNGSDHVSRKLLVAALQRWHYFDPQTCSKNFKFDTDKLDGHLADYLDIQQHRFYRPFFIGPQSADFFDSIHSFGHLRMDHAKNIFNLEQQLTRSFLHLVSETLATSHRPFVTEKFLYSIVTRGLFVAYAQPGWHAHVEKYYGFKRYTKIFDYSFDDVQNPVERLVALMSMISKFSLLCAEEWRDLYEIEVETVEHNYDWYFSGRYREHMSNNHHAC